MLLFLIALAADAERAIHASRETCLEVLLALRRAEIAGCRIIMGMAHDLGVPLDPETWIMLNTPVVRRGDATEAAELAARFRLLALLLMALLAQAGHFHRYTLPARRLDNPAAAFKRGCPETCFRPARGTGFGNYNDTS